MSNDNHTKPNPFTQLKNDIRALQDRQQRWATVVQIPRSRAIDLVCMNAQEWSQGSSFSEIDINDILNRTTAKGETGLNGLSVGQVHIYVAESVKGDCEELTILDGVPLN